MLSALVSRLVILSLGTLYPAFASYKAVRTKNVPEYVRWMMYWIMFALFTCVEAVADLLIGWWLPLYYELKMALVGWLVARGASHLYRCWVHPWLERHEQQIECWTAAAGYHGYQTAVRLGTAGISAATKVVLETAVRGGGGLVQHLQRSCSTADVTDRSDGVTRALPAPALAAAPVRRRRRSPTSRVRPRPVSESVLLSVSGAGEGAPAGWEAARSLEDVREMGETASPAPSRRRTHPDRARSTSQLQRQQNGASQPNAQPPRTRSKRTGKSPGRGSGASRRKSPPRTRSTSRHQL